MTDFALHLVSFAVRCGIVCAFIYFVVRRNALAPFLAAYFYIVGVAVWLICQYAYATSQSDAFILLAAASTPVLIWAALIVTSRFKGDRATQL